MKTRILEVLPTLKRAGAENMAVALACGLDPSRFEAAVVSLYDAFPGGLEPLLEERGVRVWHLAKRRGFDPRMWPRLAGVFSEFRPSVAHTHSYVLRYAVPVRSCPIVHTVHNLAARDSTRLGLAINRLAFRRGVLPVAVSGEVARSFRQVYGRDPAATIPNGIDAARWFRPEARPEWRRAHGFAETDVLVVSAARLEEQKDPLFLICAFARGLAHDPRCHLLMAGAGTLLGAARQCAAGSGVADRVHFLGVRIDMPELLSSCDIFALASRWEGHPLAVMEAMAARLPVVATAVGGVPEVVERGVTGLLVPPGSMEDLSAALVSLARDERRRLAMGAAAGVRASRFGVEAMIVRYAELFERAAKERV